VLYLFLSRTMLVLEEAWTEPFIVLLLAAVLFCAVRLPKVAPYVLGLFLVSKQYVPLCAPLALLLCDWPLRPRQVVDMLWRAAAAGAVVTVPLVLWNFGAHFGAFWHSAVEVQMAAPFRPDALSLLAWVYGPPQVGAPPLIDPPSAIWAFIALGVTMTLCLWLAPRGSGSRGIAGFCGAVAVSYLAFFFLNKQAFANYYFFAVGALCCAIAAGSGRDLREEVG
jgi:hypothetical protein